MRESRQLCCHSFCKRNKQRKYALLPRRGRQTTIEREKILLE